MEFRIKISSFLKYYFKIGSDQEQGDLEREVGKRVIERLRKSTDGEVVVTVDEFFSEANHGAIKLDYIEGFDSDEFDNCFDELGETHTLKLIYD